MYSTLVYTSIDREGLENQSSTDALSGTHTLIKI